ncbi:MAG: prepilin-type N-terminal cleavage/methylation domain-containing protein [Cyanobacteria bacterium P01_H01_bin.105]
MKFNRHIGEKIRYRLSNSTSGLTLIESLVAIAVIGITAASIGPVIAISAATRIQSQRAEQALRVAKGEVSRVRQVVEQTNTYTAADLGIASTPVAIADVTAALPPTAANAAFNPANYRIAQIINLDGGDPEFAVQSFRLGASENNDASGRPVTFQLGVRVYEIDAVTDNAAGLGTTAARLGTTAGEAQRKEQPLAVFYTEIIKGDERQSLCEYFEYQGSTTSAIPTLDCS